MPLVAELKRRNVIRVAMFYGVAAWVLLQVGDLLFGALGIPAWGLKLLLGLLVLGFPLALVFAWIYELTPEGLKRERKFGHAASYQYAEICTALGDRDEAMRWLDNARRLRDPGLMSTVLVDPLLDSLRSDPRFDALLRELGLAGGPDA